MVARMKSLIGLPKFRQDFAMKRKRGTLSRESVLRLRREGQTLWVLRGYAWVTYNGRDFIVGCHEKLLLPPGADQALISPLRKAELVYEIAG